MKWSKALEMDSIPDEVLYSELGRRRRALGTGRPQMLLPCKYCGEMLGTRKRKAHEPHCPKKVEA